MKVISTAPDSTVRIMYDEVNPMAQEMNSDNYRLNVNMKQAPRRQMKHIR